MLKRIAGTTLLLCLFSLGADASSASTSAAGSGDVPSVGTAAATTELSALAGPATPENPVLVNVRKVLARHDNGVGDDFALVSVRPELNAWVSPTTAVVAGPCGAYSGSGPETVWHYGHGLAIGTGGTPRAGV